MTADPRAGPSRVGWGAFFAAVLRGDIRPTSLYEFSAGTEIWRDFVGGGRQRPAYTDYLNLGYWRDRPATYREAGDALAAQLALFAGLPDPRGRRLAAVDVGFGFGEQDLLWARDFNLDLVGLNIVARQVREARERVHAAGLADRVRYLQASATAMPIASASADRVLALESAPHFDTRREFFAEAFRVLRPGGVLAAADVVSLRPLRPGLARSALAHRAAIGAARRLLRAPAANVYGPDRYRELLEAAGFVDVAIRSIGADVFPGFYRLMRRPPRDLSPSVSVWRPVMAGGSRLLLLAYRRGWADYVLVRAVKPPASAPAGSDVTTSAAGGAGLSATPHQVHDDCCIVGSGPAGAMLALLLARQGLAVTLLEQHRDFERRFRGDTLHPSILQLLDDLGLVGCSSSRTPASTAASSTPPTGRSTSPISAG